MSLFWGEGEREVGGGGKVMDGGWGYGGEVGNRRTRDGDVGWEDKGRGGGEVGVGGQGTGGENGERLTMDYTLDNLQD